MLEYEYYNDNEIITRVYNNNNNIIYCIEYYLNNKINH